MRVVVDQIPDKCKECLFCRSYRYDSATKGNGRDIYGCILLKEILGPNDQKIPGCPLVTAYKITNMEVTEDDRK